MIPLHELKLGQTAKIAKMIPGKLSIKLQELGCLPGRMVKLQSIAPLGDPICIRVNGFSLSLRITDASVMQVEPSVSPSHN
jgi:ferrous iron transport protein A